MLKFYHLEHIITQLRDNNSLEYLNMSGNNITDGNASKLVTVILKNTVMIQLYLSNCKLKDSDMSNLLNVMKHKTSLECIDITVNDKSNSTLTKDMIDIALRNPCLEQIMVST